MLELITWTIMDQILTNLGGWGGEEGKMFVIGVLFFSPKSDPKNGN